MFISFNVLERVSYILKFVLEYIVTWNNKKSAEKIKLLDNFAGKALLLTEMIQALKTNVQLKSAFFLSWVFYYLFIVHYYLTR